MATSKALITPEQYLSSHFEREPELVHGEIVERTLPTFPHGDIQLELGSRLRALKGSHPIFAGTEVRMRLAADLYRIPDIALWLGPDAPAAVPVNPPLLVVAISSPDDRWHDLLLKLEEYQQWGVQHIWVIEPELKRFHVYDRGSLTGVSRLELPQFGFTVTAAELFG
jgi:Uma2 family endonuclease